MVDAHDGETYTSEGSRLIWIDCEMTGLDIFGGDELVEVSVVPTDFDLNVLDEGVDYVIKPMTVRELDDTTACILSQLYHDGLMEATRVEQTSVFEAAEH